MVGKLSGGLEAGAGDCLEREVEGPHIQAGKGTDVLGALNTDWGVSLWQGNIFGGALRPHHFPDDSTDQVEFRGQRKSGKPSTGNHEMGTRWWCAPRGSVIDSSRSPTPSLPDMEGRKRRRQAPVPPPLAGFSLQHGYLSV